MQVRNMFITMILVILFVFVACSEKVVSKVEFLFKKPDTNSEVIVEGNGVIIKKDELLNNIKGEIYEKEKEIFDLKVKQIKTLLIEKYINKDRKSQNLKISNDEYFSKYIYKDSSVSENEIKKFVKKMKVPKQYQTLEYKERIKAVIQQEKKQSALDNWIVKQNKGKDLNVFILKPERPTYKVEIGNAPSFGKKTAKVHIVEFSDFECPHCKRAHDVVKKIRKKYKDSVYLAYKHFPLPFHKNATLAAEASLCANDENKFWAVHDFMYSNQDKLQISELKKLPKIIGLNSIKFNNCLDGHKYAEQIRSDIEEARKLGIQGVPTFFINGKLVSGAQEFELFEEIIKEELK